MPAAWSLFAPAEHEAILPQPHTPLERTAKMTRQVDAATLKQMITDGNELTLLDVREDG
jgi:hypothetical protein